MNADCPVSQAEAKGLISCIDLTTLAEDDTNERIAKLCLQAAAPLGTVAAVCIWPRFIPIAKKLLKGTDIRIATVINFPHGDDDPEEVLKATQSAVAAGADEIDVVMPYKQFLDGDSIRVHDVLNAADIGCGSMAHLKVILETGALESVENIRRASEIAIDEGAHFIKTSTGKLQPGATLEAAAVMLETIRRSGRDGIGFKAAGGIREVEEARKYRDLVAGILHLDEVTPSVFRIGASALLGNVLEAAA